MLNQIFAFLCLTCLFIGLSSTCSAQAGTTIIWSADQSDSVTTYSYNVTNRGTLPITSVVIGFDGINDYELSVLPSGWDFFEGLPSSSQANPMGWQPANVLLAEGSDKVAIEWNIDEGNLAAAVAPGESLSGFRIIIPVNDLAYSNGNWTAFTTAGNVQYHGLLQPQTVSVSEYTSKNYFIIGTLFACAFIYTIKCLR